MKSLGRLLWICSALVCYGQIDVFYTGRMMGYFRLPDQQGFDMKECPSTDQMNPAARGLYAVWLDRRGKNPERLLVGMGDNFAPDFFSRTFKGKAPDAAPVPFPGKDRYVWNDLGSDKGSWIPDTTKNLPSTADTKVPADNVGCFIRAMDYTALVPGKHDFYFGPNRLRELAKFLFNEGKGTALLAGNLSVSTSVPEAKPRLPLYEVEHEIREEQQKHSDLPSYSILPLVHGEDPSPSIKFPDVVLPTYRKFAVDNAYFLMNGAVREILADRTDKFPLKRVALSPAGVLVPLPAAPLAPAPPAVYFFDKSLTTLDPSARRTVKLRIDSLEVCENKTDAPGKNATCWTIPPALSAEDDDVKTARITFEVDHEFLKADRNYAACMHVVAGEFDTKKYKAPEYYCQPFYVSKPFFFDDESPTSSIPPRDPYAFAVPRPSKEHQKTDAARGRRLDDPFVVREITDANGKKVKVAVFGLLDPDLQGTIGRLNYGWWNTNLGYETTAQISSLTDALSQALMRCDLDDDCKSPTTRKILLAQMSAAKAAQFVGSLTKPLFDLVVTETDSSNKTLDGSVERKLPDADSSPRFVVVPDEIYAAKLNVADANTEPLTPQADQYSPGTLTFRIQKATIRHAPTPLVLTTPPPASPPQTWTLYQQPERARAQTKGRDSIGLPQIKPEANCPAEGTLKALAGENLGP